MRRRAGVLVLGVLFVAPTMGLVGSLPVAAGPAYDEAWAPGFQDALAWSTVHKDKLVAPLVAGAGMMGYAPDVIASYEHGGAWARADMRHASDRTLDARVRDLVLLAANERVTATRAGDVPTSLASPVATLLGAQLRTMERASIVWNPALGPIGHQRVLAVEGAFLLGVIDAVLPALHAAAPDASDEPILVDPLGLVIVGGNGDDTYTAPALPVRWMRPVLVIEPGGSDTYNVDVATSGLVTAASVVDQESPTPALAIDLAGNDRYARMAGSVPGWGMGILVDEQGNDHYGALTIRHAVAAAQIGFAFVGDRTGNDVYETRDLGLAYAIGWLGLVVVPPVNGAVAVLADWNGDDEYVANTGATSGDTHAVAENVGSLSVLRDYAGRDRYVANSGAFAYAEDDGTALLVDDEGEDTYSLQTSGPPLEFGRKAVNDGGLPNAPTERSIAYFLEGGGLDSYLVHGVTYPWVGDDQSRVDDRPEHKWGIFVDCETLADASIPCQDQQDDVLLAVVTSAP